MNQAKFLQATTEFRTNVLVMAAIAEAMKSHFVVTVEKDEEGNDVESKEYPFKEKGTELRNYCKNLFKKAEAFNNAMFKAKGESYTELKFTDHLKVTNIYVSSDWEENEDNIMQVFMKLKESSRNLSGHVINFDNGKRWVNSDYDKKRGEDIAKIVQDIEKLLS